MKANKSKSSQIRANAAFAIDQVITNNRTIDWVENAHPQWLEEPTAREIIYGALRYLQGLKALCDEHLDRPLRSKDSNIYALLLVGAYQLKFMNTPAHAAINETVGACRVMRRPWATRLVNAVLRKIQNTERSFDSYDQLNPAIKVLIDQQYPEHQIELSNALLSRAPMTLRVNVSAIQPAEFCEQLTQADIGFSNAWFPETLILDEAMPARALPGYQDGHVSIQDGGAQWAHHLLFRDNNLQSLDCKFLDACAAPGGKLFHTIEQLSTNRPDARLTYTALELEPKRAETLAQLGARLGHEVQPLVGDASAHDWWDGEQFSHILLDAPCSGTGTIRRHPDINVLFEEAHLFEHAQKQHSMLNNLWPMLRPGGSLLYCTCSLLEQENDQVIEAFVKQQEGEQHPTSLPSVQPLSLPTGQRTQFGWQLLPTDTQTDGFFFSLLRKPLPSAS